jgi:hypothetical protein
VLRRQTNRLRHGLEARVPALEITAQLLIEHAGPDLQQPVGARGRPTHLLSLHKPLADNLVNGGLDEAGRPLPAPTMDRSRSKGGAGKERRDPLQVVRKRFGLPEQLTNQGIHLSPRYVKM